jgi:hypothetical protein
MNPITTVAQLEAIIGRPPALVKMKELGAGRGLPAHARPRTARGLRLPRRRRAAPDDCGRREARLRRGRIAGADRLRLRCGGVGRGLLRLPAARRRRDPPGGSVAGRSPGRIVVAVSQAYVHCARAILRSRLWSPVVPSAPAAGPPTRAAAAGLLSGAGVAGGPLSGPAIVSGPLFAAAVDGKPLSTAGVADGPPAGTGVPDGSLSGAVVPGGPLSGAGVLGFLGARRSSSCPPGTATGAATRARAVTCPASSG